MEYFPIVALVVSVFMTLICAALSFYTANGNNKLRATIAELKFEITESIKAELKDFLERRDFQTYSEGHAKEHTRIDMEQGRVRDRLHSLESITRRLDSERKPNDQ